MKTLSRTRLQEVFGVTGAATPQDAARRSKRQFVRGRTQISLLEPGRTPKGHVISAFEAFESFGFDVLEEAIEYGSAILLNQPDGAGDSLRRQREALGLDHPTVSHLCGVSVADLKRIEIRTATDVPLGTIERIAFTLGLDEAQIAFQRPGSGTAIAARLKTLQRDGPDGDLRRLTHKSVLNFAEAASVIRVQNRLQHWLGMAGNAGTFQSDDDYGNQMTPAWKVGYELAAHTRERLHLGEALIPSMREFVEDNLGIPVVQAEFSQRIAGATIAVSDDSRVPCRGIILNTIGANRNPLVRRATLAHEVGHLLFDPDQQLDSVRVDSYDGVSADPEMDTLVSTEIDFVEQRANAFAISLLAPINAVRERIVPPLTKAHIIDTIETFGISVTAASFHVANAHYRNYQMPSLNDVASGGRDWLGPENFGIDFFPIRDTPILRRGRFAGLVVAAWKGGLLSSSTCAAYLNCSDEAFQARAEMIQSMYTIGRTPSLN